MDERFAQSGAGLEALIRDFADYAEYVLAAPRAPKQFLSRLNGGKYRGHANAIDCRKIRFRGEGCQERWCVIEWLAERRFKSAGRFPFVLFECLGSEPSERDIERLHAGFIETKKDFIRSINEARFQRKRLSEAQHRAALAESDRRLNYYWGKSIYDMKREAWRQRQAERN